MTTLLIAFITFVIRLLGLLRDSLLSIRLGVDVQVDDFFLMIGLAHFLTSVFATSGINFIIPEIKKSKSDNIINYAAPFVLGVSVVTLLFVFAVPLVSNFSWFMAFLGGVLFLSQSLNHMLSSLLNLKGYFWGPALLFVFPVAFTLIPLFLGECTSLTLISYFVSGSLVQLLTLIVYLLLRFDRIKRVKDYIKGGEKTKAPSIFTSWSGIALATLYFPGAELANVILAKTLQEGSAATLGYAMRIPLALASIIIFAVWTVALPRMKVIDRKGTGILSNQDWLKTFKVFGGTVIFSFVLYYLSPLIVHMVYGRGERLSQDSLSLIVGLQQVYFLALPLQVFINLIFRFLHANGRSGVTIVLSLLGLISLYVSFQGFGAQIKAIPVSFMINYGVCSLGLLLILIGSRFYASRHGRTA